MIRTRLKDASLCYYGYEYLLCGYLDDPVMADFQNYGFSEVIAKPYSFLILTLTIRLIILIDLLCLFAIN